MVDIKKKNLPDTLSNADLVTLGEVSSGGSVVPRLHALHGINRSHTPVSLDKLSLSTQKVLSRRLGGSRKETTHHHSTGAQSETLDDVSDVLDSSIGHTWNTEAAGKLANAKDSSGLRTADSHDFLGNTGRARTHTNTESISTGSDKTGSLLPGNHVSSNNINVWELLLDPLDHLDLVDTVALGAIQDNDIQTSFGQQLQSDLVILSGTNRSTAKKLFAVGALGGEREMKVLHEVGAGQEGSKVARLVNNWKLALLRGSQNGIGLLEGNSFRGGDQVSGHYLRQGSCVVRVELDVTHGNHSNKLGLQMAVL